MYNVFNRLLSTSYFTKTVKIGGIYPSLEEAVEFCWSSFADKHTPGGGGGVLPYMGYIGTCRGIGYGFGGSRSLNRVSFLTLLFLCPWCGP